MYTHRRHQYIVQVALLKVLDLNIKVGGNQKEGDRDGLIRKEGAREIKSRGPTSLRIITGWV